VPSDAPTWADFVASWELFRDPVLCALIAGAGLGYLGVYVVLRRMVFVSAAVTSSAGLGVALAFYAEIHLAAHLDPIYGATALALLASLLLLVEPRRLGLTRESMLGLAFAFAGGAAIVVESRISQEAHDLHAILFGSAVLVRPGDLQAVAWATLILGVLHVWWFRGLTFASFDEVGARVQGLPTRLLGAVVLLSIGLMVGVSARALGALPVFAFSTLPAMAALALGVRLRLVFALAALLGAASGFGGYLVSFFWDWPVGGSQTLVATVLAALAFAVRGARLLIPGPASGARRRGD
jgi:zinc transport system permease protein